MNKKQAKEILRRYLLIYPKPISGKTIIHKESDKNTISYYTYEYIKKIADGK